MGSYHHAYAKGHQLITSPCVQVSFINYLIYRIACAITQQLKIINYVIVQKYVNHNLELLFTIPVSTINQEVYNKLLKWRGTKRNLWILRLSHLLWQITKQPDEMVILRAQRILRVGLNCRKINTSSSTKFYRENLALSVRFNLWSNEFLSSFLSIPTSCRSHSKYGNCENILIGNIL